jgi:dienelactone hydrolase
MHRLIARALGGALVIGIAVAAPAVAFDPAVEAQNFAKTEERQVHVTSTPEFQQLLIERNTQAPLEAAQILADDPERNFAGNVCFQRGQECSGELRFYDWEAEGHGLQRPVLFTARSGATISGTVWATRRGPAERPAIVITTGSVQAPETLYWGVAANLAKRGYVVLTYDVQGQGQSDTLGEAPDAQEGVPSQAGQPFYDGTEDALDFLLSDRAHPYDPRPSCGNANEGTPTDHSPKQERRVEDGLNAGFNPLHRLVDPSRVGIAGHSLGAAAVSFVGQKDRRVDAIAAFDNLSEPDPSFREFQVDCPARPGSRKTPEISKPALGISNDYGIAPTPYTADPDPQAANAGFNAYRDAGVDSMQVNIRGGCHEESAFIPGSTIPVPLGCATLRGHDMVIWYSAAWFDKYVKCQGRSPRCERRADRALLSDRWLDDPAGAEVDLAGDGNLLSFYLRSRYDLGLAGGAAARCGDMREGCAQMGPDPRKPNFSYLEAGRTPDEGSG